MFEKIFHRNEQQEKGENVKIDIKFIRHGERDKDGNLQDVGREITKSKALDFAEEAEKYDAIKAIGSTAGPKSGSGMARALETSDIYSKTLDPNGTFNTRAEKILSYENLINEMPYNHRKIYDENLPENFDSLSDEEKINASKKANAAAIDYLDNLQTPEALEYKKELAGSEAVIVEHYAAVVKRINNNTKVLIVAGGHGGMLEYLLTQAMVAEDQEGKLINDWDVEKIGGDLNPSEAFNISVETDKNGELMSYKVTFDNPNRPNYPKMYLDKDKVKKLAEYYLSLHS